MDAAITNKYKYSMSMDLEYYDNIKVVYGVNLMKSYSLMIVVLLMAFALVIPACDKNSGDSTGTSECGSGCKDGSCGSDAGDESAGGASSMKPLPIEIPAPSFAGTPKPLKGIENLEKQMKTGTRPVPLAPAGASNMALGKLVTCSDDIMDGEPEMITDGQKVAMDDSYVELFDELQHITIDLEEECEIYAILFWHNHRSKGSVYYDIIVQVSDEPDFIEPVTLFNNDHDNTAKIGLGKGADKNYVESNEGKLVDGKATKGRYVRLYSNGGNASPFNHYIEVEVFANPSK